MADTDDTCARLAAAIDGGLLRPAFQPLICLETGAIVGFEVLARWTDPETGLPRHLHIVRGVLFGVMSGRSQ